MHPNVLDWDQVVIWVAAVADRVVAERRTVYSIRNFNIGHLHHRIKLVCKNTGLGKRNDIFRPHTIFSSIYIYNIQSVERGKNSINADGYFASILKRKKKITACFGFSHFHLENHIFSIFVFFHFIFLPFFPTFKKSEASAFYMKKKHSFRLLLLDRDRQSGAVRGASPPPTYRSNAGSLLR